MARDEQVESGGGAPSARTIGLGLVGVLLLWFAVVNRDEVPVSFLVGDPVETPLVFALAIAAVLGGAIGYLAGRRGERRRR